MKESKESLKNKESKVSNRKNAEIDHIGNQDNKGLNRIVSVDRGLRGNRENRGPEETTIILKGIITQDNKTKSKN